MVYVERVNSAYCFTVIGGQSSVLISTIFQDLKCDVNIACIRTCKL